MANGWNKPMTRHRVERDRGAAHQNALRFAGFVGAPRAPFQIARTITPTNHGHTTIAPTDAMTIPGTDGCFW